MSGLAQIGASLVHRSGGGGELWVSGAIGSWPDAVDAVIDLEGGLDPVQVPYGAVYAAMPISDGPVDFDLRRVSALARLVAELLEQGAHVLVHCGAGINRANLVAGTALVILGSSAEDAVRTVRARRPGALCNAHFVRAILEAG